MDKENKERERTRPPGGRQRTREAGQGGGCRSRGGPPSRTGSDNPTVHGARRWWVFRRDRREEDAGPDVRQLMAEMTKGRRVNLWNMGGGTAWGRRGG